MNFNTKCLMKHSSYLESTFTPSFQEKNKKLKLPNLKGHAFFFPICTLEKGAKPRQFSSFAFESKLNGIIEEVFDEEKLKKNKEIANEVIHYVRGKITKSSTWGVKPPLSEEKIKEWKKTNQSIDRIRKLREEIYNNQLVEKKNPFVSNFICAHLAEQSEHENCEGMAASGLLGLSNMGYEGRAGVFAVMRTKKINHVFLILGLGPNSTRKNNDSKSFGKHAVVCDPHLGKSYAVSNIQDELQNYYGLDGECRPIWRKTDSKDQIILICSNIFSSKEFIEPFLKFKNLDPEVIEIANLLNKFNTSENKKDKNSIHNEIFNKIPIALKRLIEMKGKKPTRELNKEISQLWKNLSILKDYYDSLKEKIQGGKDLQAACRTNLHTLSSQLESYGDFYKN